MIAVVAILASGAPAAALTADVGANADAGITTTGAAVRVNADAKIESRITTGKSRAIDEIDRRIKALNALNARVQAMVRVSAAQKASVASEVQGQVSTLLTLETKINADTDLDTLKTDIRSITSSYRIFLLVIPQGRILVASDKMKTVGASMTSFSAKLATRINAAQAAAKDVSALTKMKADLDAKVADSDVQASAAISLVASLTPDNGDATKAAANKQALSDARAKIKAGVADLAAARKDARQIVDALKAFHLDAAASSSASTN